MAAGSVKLPDLKQDIRVDTKDLVRAEAAAKRFKQAMNRNLRIDDSEFDRSLDGIGRKLDKFAAQNRKLTLALDLDTTKAKEQLERIKRDKVRLKVEANTTAAREEIRRLGRNVRVRIELDLTRARTQLRTLSRQLKVKLDVDTAGALAQIRALSGEKITVEVDADTTLARARILALSGQKVTVTIDGDTRALRRRIEELARSARAGSGAVGGLTRNFRLLSGAADLAAKAVGGLAVVGTIAGGLGVLGGAAVGLSAALSGTAPAALGLTGVLGGLAVTAGGLAAVFKSNEGLKGSSEILKSAFQGIQDDLQRRVNPSILEFMRSVAGLAPIARAQVPAFAQAFNEIAGMFSNLLRDSRFQDDLKLVLESGIRQFRSFGEAGRNAIQGIISLAAATGPFVERIAQGFTRATADFRDWVNEARRTGELNNLLENSVRILEALGRTVRDLAVGFKQMFAAANLSGFTTAVLETLSGIAADFRRFTAERQADMQAMFANLSDQVRQLRPLFAAVADGIRTILTRINLQPLMRGIQEIIPLLASALVEGANAVARLAELAAPSINSLLALVREVIVDAERIGTAFLRNVKPAIDALRPGVERFTEMLAVVAERIMPTIAGAARNLGAAFSGAASLIAPVVEAISSIIGLLGPLTGGLGAVVSAIAAVAIGRAIFRGLGQAITGAAAPTTRLQRALAGISAPIRNVGTGFRTAMQQGRLLAGTTDRLGNTIGATQGRFMAMQNSANGVTRVLGNMGTTFLNAQRAGASLGAGLGGLIGTSGAVTGALGRMAGAATGVAGAAFRGLQGAVSGLWAAMGGLAGVGIAAAIAGLTMYQQNSAKAAASTQQFMQAVQSTGGALNQQSADLLRQRLAQEGVFEVTQKLGLANDEVARIIEQGGPAREALVQQLRDAGLQSANLGDIFGNLGDTFGVSSATMSGAANTVENLGAEMDSGARKAADLGKAGADAGKGMSEGEKAAKALSDVFRQLRESTGTADERLKLLQNTLDGFNSTNRSAQDAQKSLNDAIRESGTSFDDLQGKIRFVNGELQTNDEVGSRVYDTTTQIADAAQQSAIAVSDDAKAHGDLAGAAQKSAAEIQKARDEVIAIATRFGASRQEAERYADQLNLVPESVSTLLTSNATDVQKQIGLVLQQIDSIPPNTPVTVTVPLARETIDSLRRIGVTVTEIPGANGQPARIEVSAPDDKVRADLGTITKLIQNPPNMANGRAEIPTGLNLTPAEQDLYGKLFPQITAPRTPANIPAGVAAGPGFQQGLSNLQGQITLPKPGAADIPAGIAAAPGFDPALQGLHNKIVLPQPGATDIPAGVAAGPGFNPGLQGLLGQIKLPPAGEPQIPAGTVPGPNFAGQLQNMMGMITAPPGGTPGMPAVVDLNPFMPGIQTAQGMVTNPAGGPPGLPINADFRPLEQGYDARLAVVQSDTRWLVRITGDFMALQAEYDRLLGIATSDQRWIVPVRGDFTALVDEYSRIAITIQTTPLYIPIYGQFMGIQGLPGGGGMGMAAGGILKNEKGRIAEFFAEGGMSAKDKATLGMVANQSAQNERKYPNGGGSLGDMATARGMGLKPMAANQASIVAPNTWRVIGDRARDDESYIPINRSPRSVQILEETAKRMGFALEQFAQGGFHSGPTANQGNTGQEVQAGARQAAASSVTNHNEAPLIGGDLSIVVPQDTPVQDAFSEAMFQLRRVKRGGVHRRTPAQTGR